MNMMICAKALLALAVTISNISVDAFVTVTVSKSRHCAALHESAQQEQFGFDQVAYEKERLEKDAEAMDAMKILAENEFAKLRTP